MRDRRSARNTKTGISGGRLRRRAAKPVHAPVGKPPRKDAPLPRPVGASASPDTKRASPDTNQHEIRGSQLPRRQPLFSCRPRSGRFRDAARQRGRCPSHFQPRAQANAKCAGLWHPCPETGMVFGRYTPPRLCLSAPLRENPLRPLWSLWLKLSTFCTFSTANTLRASV